MHLTPLNKYKRKEKNKKIIKTQSKNYSVFFKTIFKRSKKDMDFRIVISQILDVYAKCETKFSVLEVIQIFEMYYLYYEKYMFEPHPRLSNETIIDVINKLDCTFDSYGEEMFDMDEVCYYEPLIKGYFELNFDNCNYSIAHFMSGEIRTLRYYEELY